MSTTPDNPKNANDDAIDDLVSQASSKKRGRAVIAVVATVVVAVLAFIGVRSLLGGSDDAQNSSTSAPASGDSNASSVGARTPEEIKKDGTVRIGVFADKSPFGSVDADGKATGYDVVYAERIAKDLGVDVEFVPVEAASRVEFLTSGKVDIILANFTVTPERAEKVDFANPYMKVSLGVVSSKDDEVTEEAQLSDKKILVVKGTTADNYIESNHPDWDVEKFDQYTEVTNALIDGRGDVWITDNTEALAFSLQNEDKFVTGITQLGPVDQIAAAVQKDNSELLNWLNEELVSLGEENFFHDNYEQTLAPVYGEAADPEELVVEGGQL
ncbi:MAG: transporter substrate-binding domain-containing protein [Actinomycetaceae bacterium]|nr:transporter substrate-binding domain-containing protein [Actinomycetaceae bacterium]